MLTINLRTTLLSCQNNSPTLLMHQNEKANWQKIKDAMEANGTTENDYYLRAVAICSDKKDPVMQISKLNIFKSKAD